MTFALRHREPVPAAARRLLRKQIGSALSELRAVEAADAGEDPRAEAVHRARKHLKRARSVLRLVRDALPARDAQRLAIALRDAGRGLSALRDARVLHDTLESLAPDVGAVVVASVRPSLQARAADQVAAGAATLPDVVALLQQARDDAAALRPRGRDPEILARGLRDVHRRARRRFAAASKEPTAEHLHEWRKRAKDTWYHLELLAPAWADVLDPQHAAAHRLSEHLGDDHDLAVLRERLLLPAPLGDVPARTALLNAIDARRARLQAEAFTIGRRLYAESPKAFAARLVGVWRAWCDEAAADNDERAALPAPPVGFREPALAAPPPP